MKTVVIYKSKHGSTREYAEYIGKNIVGSKVFSIEEFDMKTLNSYDNVILGSSVYAGNTFYKEFLVNNWEILKEKKVFVFAVGILDKEHANSKSEYESLPEDIRSKIQYVKLPGRIVFSKLNLFEKLIIKMINSKEQLSIDDMVDLQKANSVIFYFNRKD